MGLLGKRPDQMSEKIEVRARPFDKYGGKMWVWVGMPRKWTRNGLCSWVPSFEDLFRIIQAICFCEDLKYPNGKGREMVREFLNDCVRKGAKWDYLRHKFQLPDRRERL